MQSLPQPFQQASIFHNLRPSSRKRLSPFAAQVPAFKYLPLKLLTEGTPSLHVCVALPLPRRRAFLSIPRSLHGSGCTAMWRTALCSFYIMLVAHTCAGLAFVSAVRSSMGGCHACCIPEGANASTEFCRVQFP